MERSERTPTRVDYRSRCEFVSTVTSELFIKISFPRTKESARFVVLPWLVSNLKLGNVPGYMEKFKLWNAFNHFRTINSEGFTPIST